MRQDLLASAAHRRQAAWTVLTAGTAYSFIVGYGREFRCCCSLGFHGRALRASAEGVRPCSLVTGRAPQNRQSSRANRATTRWGLV